MGTLPMECVEVAVHRDSTHSQRLGDVLDCTPQDERSELIETTDGDLLAGPRQRGQWHRQFSLDDRHDAVEGPMDRREPYTCHGVAAPPQWNVGSSHVGSCNRHCARGVDQRLQGHDERMRFSHGQQSYARSRCARHRLNVTLRVRGAGELPARRPSLGSRRHQLGWPRHRAALPRRQCRRRSPGSSA